MKRLFILLLACLTLSLNAQEKKENRQEQIEQIESQKIAFFTAELELTPEEAQLFWPVYNQNCKNSDKAHWATVKALKALKKAIKNEKSSEEIAECFEKYKKARDYEYKILSDMPTYEGILSPEKAAKLYIAEDEFRWKLFNQVWKKEHPKKKD